MNIFLRALIAIGFATALQFAVQAVSPLVGPVHAASGGGLTCGDAPILYDASTNGSTRLFQSPDTKRSLIICGYMINNGGVATNVQLIYGTGAACVTGTVNITPNWVLAAAGQVNMQGGNWEGLTVPPGFDFCIKTSAGNPVQALFYVSYF